LGMGATTWAPARACWRSDNPFASRPLTGRRRKACGKRGSAGGSLKRHTHPELAFCIVSKPGEFFLYAGTCSPLHTPALHTRSARATLNLSVYLLTAPTTHQHLSTTTTGLGTWTARARERDRERESARHLTATRASSGTYHSSTSARLPCPPCPCASCKLTGAPGK